MISRGAAAWLDEGQGGTNMAAAVAWGTNMAATSKSLGAQKKTMSIK